MPVQFLFGSFRELDLFAFSSANFELCLSAKVESSFTLTLWFSMLWYSNLAKGRFSEIRQVLVSDVKKMVIL